MGGACGMRRSVQQFIQMTVNKLNKTGCLGDLDR